MRIFFRFPELLLILAMVAAPAIVPNTTFEIQLPNSHIFFPKTSWGFNSVFISINFFLLITWVIHLLARKYKWLPVKWRWVQVIMTLIILTVMVKTMCNRLLWMGDWNSYVGFNQPAWEKFQSLEHLLTWTILLFLLTQVLFWIIAIIALIVSLVRHRRNARA